MSYHQYGPWALIAGGSDGIGAAFAREVASHGINLALIGRRADALEEMSAELHASYPSIDIRTISQDLAQESAIEHIKAKTSDIEVGCLIYNAGSESKYGDFLDHDWDFLYGRVQRNVIVKTALTHHFGRLMRARKHGAIILMGSVAGFSGSPGFAVYGASKGYTHTLSEGLWFELRKDNVHLLCPVVGQASTPTMLNSYGQLKGHVSDPAYIAKGVWDRITQGPIWVADDVAERVAAEAALPPVERIMKKARGLAEFAKLQISGQA